MKQPDGGRQHLQRVPPHDYTTERRLLGAALYSATAAELVAGLDPRVFYWPSHQTIATTITRLHTEGHPIDVGVVAAQLRADGQLDAVRSPQGDTAGDRYLARVHNDAAPASTADKLAELLVGHHHKRRVLDSAREVVEAVYSGIDTSGLIAQMHEAATAQEAARHSTWEPVNLTAVLAGEGERLEPTILARNDGAHLLYPARINAFNAESESGKSWLATWACLQQIRLGNHVLYVDFEDSPESVVERLLAMGATPAELLERFHYIRPDDPIDARARVRITEALNTWPITLAVLDGVTEAMVTSGWSIKDNDDIARFYAALPRLIERAGAAVLLIDHVTKDRETRGNYAIGGQHKRAGITGAAYSLEVVKPFGRGLHGIARLTVTKDKHGQVRAVAAGGKNVGEFHLDSRDDGTVHIELRAPERHDPDTFRPTIVMEKVSRELEKYDEPVTAGGIAAVVGGKKSVVFQAVKILAEEGYITREKAGRGYLHRSVRPYRQVDDPHTQTPLEPPNDWTRDAF